MIARDAYGDAVVFVSLSLSLSLHLPNYLPVPLSALVRCGAAAKAACSGQVNLTSGRCDG